MKYEKYIGMLKSKILSEEDIKEICKEFNLTEPNFNDSRDWNFKIMASEMIKNDELKKFKQYLTKFPNSNGLDLKKLKKQINLSFEGKTPEQQRNGMFKTMNEANKNRDSYDTITFEELQNDIIKKGGSNAIILSTMRNQHEERMKETCDICGKPHKDHDSRGFIYFHGDDKLKAGWSCVEEIVRKNKIDTKKDNKIQAKIEKDNRGNDDRSLEGWSNIILGK